MILVLFPLGFSVFGGSISISLSRIWFSVFVKFWVDLFFEIVVGSISILKDASAAAIYGSKAAAGVVLRPVESQSILRATRRAPSAFH